jgi:hypothetical protein
VVDTAGRVSHLIGGPNTQFSGFRGAVLRTVTSPGYTADRFRAALAAKPAGWLFGDPAMAQQEALERAIFMAPNAAEQFLATVQTRALAGAQRIQATLGTFSYAVPNSPGLTGATPGFMDAIGFGVAIITDPATHTADELRAILPPGPALADILSVWREGQRPHVNWDGSIASGVHNDLGAEVGVVGNPAAVSMDNAIRAARFITDLPPPPYPFDINTARAARGKDLFDEYCAGCHTAGTDELFFPEEVGTDAGRTNVWTPTAVTDLISVLRTACTDPVACTQADGSPIPDDRIVRSTGGYMAVPLDGLWARAPYLHNGSVPTLSALLTGDRPATFFRGNLSYDQINVGFTWDRPGPGAALFDTTRASLSNAGHDTEEFLGDVDWANEPAKRADLIEYLKTL